MDVEKGRNDFILGATRVVQEIRKAAERRHFKEIDLIAVIATLGHGFASGAYPEAMKLLRSEFPDTIIMSFAVTPFHFQGPEIRNRALEALKICKREGVAVTPISNQVAGQKLGTDPRKLGYMEAYTKINEQISRLLSSLFSAMCAEDGVVESLDRNDLKRIWQPESVLIGQATYPIPTAIGQSSPSDAERTIFAEIRGRGGKAVASYPTTYIIDTSGHVSTSQIAALNEELTTNYLADWGLLKPLIIERERSNTEFMLIRGGVDLGV
jgi:cell division GTPase FtsZ